MRTPGDIANSATRPAFPRVSGEVVFAVLLFLTLLGLRVLEARGISLPSCRFLEMTGVPCPGCAGTRSMLAIGHGDLPHAFRLNPLLAAGVLALLCLPLLPLLPPRLVRLAATVPRRVAVVAILLNWAYLIVFLPR